MYHANTHLERLTHANARVCSHELYFYTCLNHNLGMKENIPDYIRRQNTTILTHTIFSIHASCTHLHIHLYCIYATAIPLSCTAYLPLTISPPARSNFSTYPPLANISTGTPIHIYQDCQTARSTQHTHLKLLLMVKRLYTFKWKKVTCETLQHYSRGWKTSLALVIYSAQCPKQISPLKSTKHPQTTLKMMSLKEPSEATKTFSLELEKIQKSSYKKFCQNEKLNTVGYSPWQRF